MVLNIVNMLSKAFMPNNVQRSTAVKTVSNNPFGNPFMTDTNNRNYYATYAKNKPVQGGYFAGYINGRQNIVGQRLFVEA